ncbi:MULTISPECIES: hypothetical protein [Acinetobacter]|uniref:hypothetical protein n=1 Tax=Acinetobacter TaxID=469 RepID=UPI0002D0FE82|nr:MULTISPECIES: hypothetical protein [Acinetobacter]ENX57387.1 hypothetical protein F885_03546 [Acinetobacter higginsii]MCH7318602.1 hypothetical protein [Acinetobacter higginsii]
MKIIKDLVKLLYQIDRIEDLLEIMEQDSPYSSDNIDNIPKTKEDKELFVLAENHLRFVVKFWVKNTSEVFVDNGRSYISFQYEFNRWMDSGCKGIELNEISQYLQESPIV